LLELFSLLCGWFGALFQNAPQGLFGNSQSYGQFLGAGVITAFAGALMLVCW